MNLRMIARPLKSVPETSSPLVVAGLFRTANGIGAAARSTYSSLIAAGLSPIAVDLSEKLAYVDMDPDIPLSEMPSDRTGTLILQLNGPETVAGLQYLNMGLEREWYTVGYWAWELPAFPQKWEIAFPFLSEIWAVSEFAAKAIRQHSDTPNLRVFGHAISPPEVLLPNREKFEIPNDTFVFLTLADSMSSLSRKNPFVVIAGFKRAFENNPNVRLIVKTRNLDIAPKAHADLVKEIGGAKNIRLLDSQLTPHEIWELFSSIDSVVSLHRSEGFGLPLAEAMAIGKPVIATGWSGNMDFTTSETALLAQYSLVPCDDNYGIYKDKTTKWANVSEEEASKCLQKLYSNRSFMNKIGKSARKQILKNWSSTYLGEAMAEALAQKAYKAIELS